jgi:hypothetical protein
MESLQPVTWIQVHCPTCYETFEVALEADIDGVMTVDCEVCCRPVELVIDHDFDGEAQVLTRPFDD